MLCLVATGLDFSGVNAIKGADLVGVVQGFSTDFRMLSTVNTHAIKVFGARRATAPTLAPWMGLFATITLVIAFV